MIKTENFTENEFVRSEVARKHGIDNALKTSAHRENAQFTLLNLEKVREVLGNKPLIISSGYRCSELNKKVGGSNKSQHMTAEAADIQVRHMSVKEACNKIINSDIEFCQLINEFNSWIHVSFSRTNNQRQILTAVKNSEGKTEYKQGLL